ncbi:MAG: mechanosensitive ion channel domain-containing protein [Candidatus Saccharimonadales bacterium]
MAKVYWRRVYLKLLPSVLLFAASLALSIHYGSVIHGTNLHNQLLALIGVIAFVVGSAIFLQFLSSQIRKDIVNRRLGAGRAAALQFIIRLFGYLIILFITLDRIGIAVGHILLGSAVFGVILGVAAQQALANFFASVVLIISHPFSVGQRITLVSGALGGKYEGTIRDIGLTHTTLKTDGGEFVKLPNSTILVGGAVIASPKTVSSGSQTTET